MLPTILYIKEHEATGLRYFGKTTKEDVLSYNGSGVYWKRHLMSHGKNVKTIWVSEPFTDKEELVEFAEFFSVFHNIVNSEEWANLTNENGLDGWIVGQQHPKEVVEKITLKLLGQKRSEETKAKMRIAALNRSPHSEETKAKMRGRIDSENTKAKKRKSKLGVKRSEETKAKISTALLGNQNKHRWFVENSTN